MVPNFSDTLYTEKNSNSLLSYLFFTKILFFLNFLISSYYERDCIEHFTYNHNLLCLNFIFQDFVVEPVTDLELCFSFTKMVFYYSNIKHAS
jgi:hypothetical protein